MKKLCNELAQEELNDGSEILVSVDGAYDILQDAGLHCLGCPMSNLETMEQGAKAHSWSEKKLEKILKKLNQPN